MRALGNGIQTIYGQVSILAPAGQAAQILQGSSTNIAQIIGNGGGAAQSIVGSAGLSASTEYAGNAKTFGSSSLFVGQDGAGNSIILARGAQSLAIGVNSGSQISISSAGALSTTPITIVTPSGGNPLTMGDGTVSAAIELGGSTLQIGTISTHPLLFFTNNTNRATISAAGGLFMTGATGGDQGIGTINATGIFVNGVAVGGGATTGSFTGGITGCTTSPTGTCFWTKIGTAVTLYIPTITAVSNTTAMTLTGLPVAIQPATSKTIPGLVTNNSLGAIIASAQIAGSTVSYALYSSISGSPGAGGFTASGTKGISATVLCYDIN